MKKISLIAIAILFTLLNVSSLYADKIREGVILYKAKSNLSASELKSLNGILNSHILSEIQSLDSLGIKVVKLKEKGKELAVSKLLNQTGAVEFAEPDIEVSLSLTPDDARFSDQWHHSTIKSTTAWNNITTGTVNVCVLDTGVDMDHPDLIGNLLPGYNANGLSTVEDVHGHGTGTAGVIGAVGNNGIGAVGVLWNVNIVPVQINISDTNSSAYISTMANGIRWCADQGVKVANLSYGGAQYSTIDSAATYLRDKGGLLFMSAGNDGTYNDTSSYPDWNSFVIVGATDQSDVKSSFSEYGPFVDIVAPGRSIFTTYKNGGYVYYTGTSFSSPMTAGLGAMLFSINSEFTPDLIENFLFNSAVDLGVVGDDDSYGHGRIDAAEAVNMALNYSMTPNEDPVAKVTTSLVNGIAPLEVIFDGSTSTDDGIIVSYEWNFDDGNIAEGINVSHTYINSGTYNVTLTVTDDRGAKNTSDAVLITVEPDPTYIIAPSALSSLVDTNIITLDWLDNSDNEAEFIVERAKKTKGKYRYSPLPDTVLSNITSFSDVVSEIGDYRYRVKAANGNYESEYSNVVSVKVETLGSTPEPTPTITTPVLSYSVNGKVVNLMWTECSSESSCTYEIQKGDSKVKGRINFAPYKTNLSSLSESHSEVSGVYYFKVRAILGEEKSSYSNIITVRVR